MGGRTAYTTASRPRCRGCSGRVDPAESLELLVGYADNPLLVKGLIQALATEYNTTELQQTVCTTCILNRFDRVMADATWQPDALGHYVLSPDAEQYGRGMFEETRASVVSAANTHRRRPTMSESTTETIEPEANTAEPTTEVTAAPAEAKKTRLQELQEEFPVGQLVELKGGDYPKNQGIVTDVVEKARVAYVQVQLMVYTDGRRRPEGNKQPTFTLRDTSLVKIEAYRAEPVKAATPTPAPAETAAAEPVVTPATVEAGTTQVTAPAAAMTEVAEANTAETGW
jgi:hypothetical protein